MKASLRDAEWIFINYQKSKVNGDNVQCDGMGLTPMNNLHLWMDSE